MRVEETRRNEAVAKTKKKHGSGGVVRLWKWDKGGKKDSSQTKRQGCCRESESCGKDTV